MHVREGYITCLVCVCVCVCVRVSATNPAAISLVFTQKMRYVWLHYRLFKVLDLGIFESLLFKSYETQYANEHQLTATGFSLHLAPWMCQQVSKQ